MNRTPDFFSRQWNHKSRKSEFNKCFKLTRWVCMSYKILIFFNSIIRLFPDELHLLGKWALNKALCGEGEKPCCVTSQMQLLPEKDLSAIAKEGYHEPIWFDF
ncbi:hypothetical protein EUGRSUZ_J01206 [Eucalyptus grandis]|uniref:Uncharacterized protein n=2 Tax=Eucalyptus grandis TaxID=71139 RepID=A0ACC3J5J2_EUCGR|nr:hypothetical protein EUGRSUZ_J01206 [Eucalyptus grandis]